MTEWSGASYLYALRATGRQPTTLRHRGGVGGQQPACGGTWSAGLASALASSGWYDFTVTVSTDMSWSRRYTGHLENGLPSITG